MHASSSSSAPPPAPSDTLPKGRQNRIVRACDFCRKRKIRCDAAASTTGTEGLVAEQPCSFCAAQGVPCTFAERPVKRPPPKGYVESLERRLEAMEGLLSNLSEKAGVAPSPAPTPAPAPAPAPALAPLPSVLPPAPLSQQHTVNLPSATHTPPQPLSSSSRAPSPPPTDLDAIHDLSERLDDLVLQADRYIGRESGLHLVESVHAYVGAAPVCEHIEEPSLVEKLLQAEHVRRPVTAVPVPPPDLAHRLLEAFFTFAAEAPLIIHRPYFEECVSKGLVETDNSFRGLYFSACALGARFIDDPRLDALLASQADDENQLRTARGYSYFWTAVVAGKDPFLPATLYDLQAAVLQVLWLLASTGFITTWTFLGFAVRRAVDVGAHRETRTRWTLSPLQDQLRKRSFHMLCSYDRYISAALGRPVAIQDDDMDVLAPLDISDEDLSTWDRAAQLAQLRREPPPSGPTAAGYGQPGSMWTSGIELHQIMGHALKVLYGLRRDKSHASTVRSVGELDAALNAWLRRIPPHLAWNPAQQSDADLGASAWFIATYFQTQILIHREFISPMRSRALGFSSLAICSNAARATANVLDTLRHRGLLERSWAWAPVAAVTSGLMLLLGVFANPPGPPRPTLTSSAASDVKRCINALAHLSKSSFMAGGMHDALCNLARVSAAPPPPPAPPQAPPARQSSLKRGNADEWTDGRSPVTESGGSSDKPSPVDAAGMGAQTEHGGTGGSGSSSKARKLQNGLPFSTQDLSCPTFNGRPTFLFGGPAPPAPVPPTTAAPPSSLPQPQPADPPAGLAYFPGLADAGFFDFINGSATDGGGAPLNAAASFLGSSSAPAAALHPAPAAPPPPPQQQQPPTESFFVSPGFWSLPLDDPHAVPPAVNAATGELLSQLGLPAGFMQPAPDLPMQPRGAWEGWSGVQQQQQQQQQGFVPPGQEGFGYDATLFGGLSPFLPGADPLLQQQQTAPPAAAPSTQQPRTEGFPQPFATGSGL